MTSVLIIGGGGMIGQKLALSYKKNDTVSLLDMAFPDTSNVNAKKIVGSVTDAGILEKTVSDLPDTIFYLASVVSGEAEVDFSKGWDVNIHAFWSFLAQIRDQFLKSDGQYRPKIIFTSSIAVFGSPFPNKISDDFLTAPRTSYGAQKACCELMLNDFIRKGFCEGLAIRLPTICVRPGKPNLAASSFFSGIIREPLNGLKANLPVSTDVRHWHASPRSAVRFLRHAESLHRNAMTFNGALNMPGLSCTVEEQIEALRSIAGNQVVKLIEPNPDEKIIEIVKGWPQNFDTKIALDLGFSAEGSFEDIIQIYIDDDLQSSVIKK
jgi:nucleoside-diphosphate-sugar epimerase